MDWMSMLQGMNQQGGQQQPGQASQQNGQQLQQSLSMLMQQLNAPMQGQQQLSSLLSLFNPR